MTIRLLADQYVDIGLPVAKHGKVNLVWIKGTERTSKKFFLLLNVGKDPSALKAHTWIGTDKLLFNTTEQQRGIVIRLWSGTFGTYPLCLLNEIGCPSLYVQKCSAPALRPNDPIDSAIANTETSNFKFHWNCSIHLMCWDHLNERSLMTVRVSQALKIRGALMFRKP